MKWLSLLAYLITWQASAQWAPLDLPRSARYDDIFFLNDTLGWAVGGPNGRIYRTVDGGVNWAEVFQSDKYLRSIEFSTPLVGIAGSLQRGLYRSDDGGLTWTDIYDQINPVIPEEGDGICGLSAPSDSIFYACGEWTSPAYFLKSTDAGQTWTYQDMSSYALTLVDALFLDDQRGFITGRSIIEEEGGIILYTEDGGDTWEKTFTTDSIGDYVWKIQTPDSLHFFGSVQSLSTTGNIRIVRSENAGQTWEVVEVLDSYNYMQMVGFLTPELGWTAGDGRIFQSEDGGDTWEEIIVGAWNYNRFFKINDSTAFFSANQVYEYDPTPPIPPLSATDFERPPSWMEVYPNPVSRELQVRLSPPSPTYVQLTLYDMKGRKIDRLWDGPISTSESITWPSSAQPAGTYLLNLQTHDQNEQRLIQIVNP